MAPGSDSASDDLLRCLDFDPTIYVNFVYPTRTVNPVVADQTDPPPPAAEVMLLRILALRASTSGGVGRVRFEYRSL